MRKIIAILFIVIFFINTGGYQIWISLQENIAEHSLISSLDKDLYNDQELVRIVVPLSNAYQNDWSEFKRVDGEVTFDGKVYHYVKQKVENGQMILLCIADKDKMTLETAKIDILKRSMDLTNTRKHTNSKMNVKQGVDEFTVSSFTFIRDTDQYKSNPTIYTFIGSYRDMIHRLPDQPPDIMIV